MTLKLIKAGVKGKRGMNDFRNKNIGDLVF